MKGRIQKHNYLTHKGQSVKGEILIFNFIFNLKGEFSVRKSKMRKILRFSQLACMLSLTTLCVNEESHY